MTGHIGASFFKFGFFGMDGAAERADLIEE